MPGFSSRCLSRFLKTIGPAFLLLLVAGALSSVEKAEAATFTVTKTADTADGTCDADCSLREAITAANAAGGADTISFAIPGAGTHTITLISTALPVITSPVTIDGLTQSGASANTNSVASGLGSNAVLTIELDGSALSSGIGLEITAGSSTVRGLVINGFAYSGTPPSGSAIALETTGGNVIEGNFISTNVAGTTFDSNFFGMSIQSGSNGNTIGGTTAAARNVINGAPFGLRIQSGATGNVLQGNLIGTRATGTASIGSFSLAGIALEGADGNTIGGTVTAARNVISGNDTGIDVQSGATGNTIQGNYIGTDVTGTGDVGNSTDGIGLGGTSNTVGGTSAGARNVISGNGSEGIGVRPGATGNVIQGNYIGTNASGTGSVPNDFAGLYVVGDSTAIGGTAAGAGNLISGNGGVGMRIESSSNTIQGNLIGTKADGVNPLGNDSDGVQFITSPTTTPNNNTVGGTVAGAGNTIAHNGGSGVWSFASTFSGSLTSGNRFQRNSIHSNTNLGIELTLNTPGVGDGVTPNDTGDGDVGPNGLQNYPVLTSAVSGGTTSVTGSLNSIASSTYTIDYYSSPACDPSGNGEGKTFIGSASVTTDVGGNVGFTTPGLTGVSAGSAITATATSAAGNTSEFSACRVACPGGGAVCVVVNSDADTNDGACTTTAGGCTLREAIIAANAAVGAATIVFNIPPSGAHTIAVNSTGLGALPTISTVSTAVNATTQPGYLGTPIISLDGTAVTGAGDGLRDTVNGSSIKGLSIGRFPDNGIELVGVSGVTVDGNYVGVDMAGTSDVGNVNTGVYISGGSGNTIGGTLGNVISGNDNHNGIGIETSNLNVVKNNRIGTNAAGTSPIPNGTGGIAGHGIRITGPSVDNVIGGAAPGDGNVISGNFRNGVSIENDTADSNDVIGNKIGTDASGTSPIGNGLDGVRVEDADDTNIVLNVVAYNSVGVDVRGSASNTTVQQNSIYSNGFLGIDLNGDGVTLNDSLDPDTGPNGLMNFPVVSSAKTGATTQITWSLNTVASVTVRVEFFASTTCDTSGYGEGQRYLGFHTLATNGSGNASATETLAATTSLGEFITATASRSSVETSEFSLCRAPDTDGDGVIDTADNCPSAANPGQENNIHPLTPAGDACDDGDADTIVDSLDNCPNWSNTSQALPNWPVPSGDSDCDGFPDTVNAGPPSSLSSEAFLGTDGTRQCASTTGTNPAFRNDEPPPDRWPADFDDNGISNGQDVLTFAPHFGATVPSDPRYDNRWDLFGADGKINGQDLLKLAPFFTKTCT